MKLTTPVEFPKSGVTISCGDRIMSLGSCFADGIGRKLLERGFDVCLNPFGTLYNPASIADGIARLDSGGHFTERDCVRMGSGSAKWCSFHHHTLAARDSREEFLASANEALDRASAFWKSCNKVLVTLGTSWCYRFTGSAADQTGFPEVGGGRTEGLENGIIVANCLKRDAREFRREFLPAGKTAEIVRRIVLEHPDKDFIFTVSPIRHFKDGAHGNQLSKANLLLGLDAALKEVSCRSASRMPASGQLNSVESGSIDATLGEPAFTDAILGKPVSPDGGGTRCGYFPAYEIMLDELRDYRFYAEDMIHPSEQAVNYIFERFIGWALPETETEEFKRRDKAFRQSRHIPLNDIYRGSQIH